MPFTEHILYFQYKVRYFTNISVIGFLSTRNSDAQGNYALLDQVAALHWIKANIRAFGGDPGEVTLMGHGHGAAMVNLLMISPVTRGRHTVTYDTRRKILNRHQFGTLPA